jgi:superfamily II RNA helicase
MDEFHFYGDPERGWAWQVPLLELPRRSSSSCRRRSATRARSSEAWLAGLGRPVAVVRSATRPVPLHFEYRRTPLHETIESLLAADQAPLYVVHFTQARWSTEAQALTSAQVTTGPQRDAISAALVGFRFAPGFGRTLSRLLHHGIGVHHGGMLPKYRRLVERLTQAGLLRVVVGTDTLGVGVNLPLADRRADRAREVRRHDSRLLSARELHQIAGRAGRAGYDTSGSSSSRLPSTSSRTSRPRRRRPAMPAGRASS